MKIVRFISSGVHGFIDLDINFFPDLTFLTGINGSGKTTVVNGISALIAPSLLMLVDVKYQRMEVQIEHNQKNIKVWTTKDETNIYLHTSETKQILEIPILTNEMFDVVPAYRMRDERIKYYREQEVQAANHPVFKLIKGLPTPMFLNIERRFEDSYEYRALPTSARRRTQNIFSSSLSRSLLEAASLAETRYRLFQSRLIELKDALRKKFLLTAIQYKNPAKAEVKFPRINLKTLYSKQLQITSILTSLGLEETEVTKQLTPFFEKLRHLSTIIPSGKTLDQLFKEHWDADDKNTAKDKTKGKLDSVGDMVNAFIEWMVNKPQFDRIMAISKHADDYVKLSESSSKKLDEYLDTINQFLNDSHKALKFDAAGNLIVVIDGKHSRPINSLSSGESQLVVILTHLTFNPSAHLANVFIVDEPELSLHVRWQDLFVSAIRAAAPQLQLILATHSPSIIQDDIEHCVDLSVRPRGNTK